MPLREDRGDLIVELFGDEVIEPGLILSSVASSAVWAR